MKSKQVLLVLKGRVRRLTSAMAATGLLMFSGASAAGPISDLFVFGDSLSDSGAFNFLAPAFCPPSPYAGCRFSNGPVWAENVAASLGVSGATAYGGGTNYAIGGQRSDEVLGGQVPAFGATVGGTADPNALYVLWAGGNDFLQDAGSGGAIYDPVTAAGNVVASVSALAGLGATDFLVANLPILDPWAFDFNLALAAGLAGLGGLDIIQFDMFGLFGSILTDPGAFGFTNVADPCFVDPVTVCANPDEYLLWDEVHPTARAHEIIAEAALALLPPHQVPVPATLVVLALGLAGLGWSRRRTA